MRPITVPNSPNKGDILIVNPKIFPYLLRLLSIFDNKEIIDSLNSWRFLLLKFYRNLHPLSFEVIILTFESFAIS